jgi:tripartite-type tricarboxylate transporter receptor subunit TctC
MAQSLTAGLLPCALTAAGAHAASLAPDYPSTPIRIIVPTPAGGGNDIMARLVGQSLSETWGPPVVVDNRAGAGGAIAMELAAKGAPDGYTLLLGTTSLTVLPSMAKVEFDPVRDFVPVALIATASNILLVHPSVGARSLQELLSLARTKPGYLNYASGNIAS